jgi:hypothetical protein
MIQGCQPGAVGVDQGGMSSSSTTRPRRRALGPAIVVGVGALAAWPAPARPRAAAPEVAAAPGAKARRRSATIAVDGRLAEADWAAAAGQGGFWQREPHEGRAPSEATEFRVLYDDEAVYVGVQAFDRRPDEIKGLLTRRDEDSSSDWILVGLDSYFDRRTAFVFGVNPAGVQRDFLLYDDVQEDASWDAVWTGAAARTAEGWTAEFRIPLSQLRFSSSSAQRWGLQVLRYLERNAETSLWAPAPRAQPRMVSLFGTLHGLDGITPGRRLEVLPYTSGGLDVASVEPGDPFRGRARGLGNAGIDLRYGLTSAFTLSLSVNPDFGQVEADPSQVNLGANELFLPEKRPFFLEGTDIVQFGLEPGGDGGETLFYSRRIGAAPHGEVDAAFVDAPTATTIYGAAKVSGKTEGGTSVGVLAAVTGQEVARTADDQGGRAEPVVEPLAAYAVARAKQDFGDGRTVIGAIATAVGRQLDDPALAEALHDRAFAGGLELSHRWGGPSGDAWSAAALVVASHVHGSAEAIAEDQRLTRHLYQRPDATHLEFDPTRTALTGSAVAYKVGRDGTTEHWRAAAGGWLRSPDLEVNDLGFQTGGDAWVQWGWMQYRDEEPGAIVRRWNLNANPFVYGDTSPELTGYGGNANVNVGLVDYWSLNAGVNAERPLLDTALLRGGPAVRADPSWNTWANISTDERKRWQVALNGSFWRRRADDAVAPSLSASVLVQARPNLSLGLEPMYATRVDGLQYVGEFTDQAGQPHYVLAQIRQQTAAVTVRASWTFSPRLSLQVYAQPFAASGQYSRFKEPSAPRADRLADRYHELSPDLRLVAGEVVVDRDDDGAADYVLGQHDFVVRELRSNLVLRWEYRPGSSVFLIWAQGRGVGTDERYLDLGRDLGQLLDAPSQHVVMLKANYWVGL